MTTYLIAPTALKGSLSAAEAAEVIASALPPDVTGVRCPVADGGDGTLDCLVFGTNGQYHDARVTGPVHDRPLEARWGVLGDGTTAVIELAEAAGLRLLRPPEYDVLHATTYGVGELVHAALEAGHRHLLVGLGGSATNDGGAGIVRALGVRFLDAHGRELPNGGIHLGRLQTIDRSGLHPAVRSSVITLLADVHVPLCGPEGAASLFAGQKGATRDQIDVLDSALRQYESVIARSTGLAVGSIPGAGAAGGAGVGLAAFCGAHMVRGAEFILDALQFEKRLEACDAVLTAEGTLDGQTLRGKAVAALAARARTARKPVHVFVGRITEETALAAERLGIASVHPITARDVPFDEAVRTVRPLLMEAVRRFCSTTGPHA